MCSTHIRKRYTCKDYAFRVLQKAALTSSYTFCILMNNKLVGFETCGDAQTIKSNQAGSLR